MDIDKLITDISSESEQKRTSAVERLGDGEPAIVLPRVADVMLEIGTPEIVGACFDVLERFEASASLAEVRMDGWFDQVSQHIAHVDEISSVMGARFLAYAFVLNIQIRSLMVDPLSPASTAVHFCIGNEQIQTLSLGEFKVRVVQTLLRDDRVPIQPTLPFHTEAAVAVVGGRNILIAPLFGITIERVMVTSLPPAMPRYLVAFVTEEGFSIAELGGFLELLRDRLREDMLGSAGEPFSIDLYAVERARAAAEKEESNKVIEILEAWPGILSVLQRAPIKKNLDDEQLVLIGEGVCLLGEALEKENQFQWSEELYKLGLQFIREGEVAARLFGNLGKILVRNEGYGESIGHLRRALVLGFPKQELLPALGRAFLKRNLTAPAYAVLKMCRASAYTAATLDEDMAEVERRLDTAGIVWDVPLPDDSIVEGV